MNIKYDLDDIALVPAELSGIESRSWCNPYLPNQMLPIFAAPMGAVIDDQNFTTFQKNRIGTVIPRTVPLYIRLQYIQDSFIALSLSEFENFIKENDKLNRFNYVCVDLANGHMKSLIDLCAQAKAKFGQNLILMTGNIANPLTYYHYASAGIDYVRVSVGNGDCCTTGSNVSCFYPMKSLIEEIVEIKNEISRYPDTYKSVPKIIADGGFNSFDRIIKALALGADYVMIGKLFAECEEACGSIFTEYKAPNEWTEKEKKDLVYTEEEGYHLRLREYYGMSTKHAQRLMGKTELHTSEGIVKYVHVNKTLPQWVENFTDYLRSAMSYTNSYNLKDFALCKKCYISEAARKSYYK